MIALQRALDGARGEGGSFWHRPGLRQRGAAADRSSFPVYVIVVSPGSLSDRQVGASNLLRLFHDSQ